MYVADTGGYVCKGLGLLHPEFPSMFDINAAAVNMGVGSRSQVSESKRINTCKDKFVKIDYALLLDMRSRAVVFSFHGGHVWRTASCPRTI